MKTRIASALALFFLVNAANADIILQLPSGNGDITGYWEGKGSMHATLPFPKPLDKLHCEYKGGGDIKKLTGSDFSFIGRLDLIPGPSTPGCPGSERVNFKGTATGNTIKVEDGNVKLNGTLNSTMTTMHLAGTILFDLMGLPIIAYVDTLDMTKK